MRKTTKKILRANAPKIGVLTFHRCINYGSFWQALSLVNWLNDRGHNAVIIDHHSRRVNLAEWKCAFRPLLPTPVPRSDFPFYRKKIEKFFLAISTFPLSCRISLDDPSEMEEFDVVVVGSDEVWNLYHPWYGGHPLFFGTDIRAKRLVSYSASFGNYNASAGLGTEWAERLRGFERISVRDVNSRLLVNESIGMDPEVVLDPCFLNPPHISARKKNETATSYIAVYGHNFSDEVISAVRDFAKRRNLILISIGYGNEWTDRQMIAAGPFEYEELMRSAKAIVTNFFHGCVFALLYSKPFICEATAYRSNKVRDLLHIFGEEARIFDADSAKLPELRFLAEPTGSEIRLQISELRKSSERFLSDAVTY